MKSPGRGLGLKKQDSSNWDLRKRSRAVDGAGAGMLPVDRISALRALQWPRSNEMGRTFWN